MLVGIFPTEKNFFKNKGFASHNHVMSGDDDLFINETATSKNTRIELHPSSFTVSEPRNSWLGWFSQKKRHMSTGKLYKPGHKFMIGTFFFSMFVFLCCTNFTLSNWLSVGSHTWCLVASFVRTIDYFWQLYEEAGRDGYHLDDSVIRSCDCTYISGPCGRQPFD
ncbi:MAG: hypothetical protein IPI23_03505 [Bacteroidetes bacterium]|nr:hypothetical protein [Bacteroidota bacterium]